MAITIDRTARDALYEEVLTELSGSDVWAEMQSGDYDAARRTRDRLLDDIGWEPDSDRKTFELTMPPGDFARALRTLNDTLDTYIHLMDGEDIDPLNSPDEIAPAQWTGARARLAAVASGSRQGQRCSHSVYRLGGFGLFKVAWGRPLA